ncbi:MAG TPA: hypothetical protein PKA06_13300 [Gemmatales bacterium]|nr:hypothetical protein [Gemmatales bacterium]HMP15486.1 hypothetical protein [Gemmatales bacterium]
MNRLHQTAFMVLLLVLFYLPTIQAQVVSITAVTSTQGDVVSEIPVGPVGGESINYTHFNWRAGLLSPFANPGTTGSATTTTLVPAVPINTAPVVSNPILESVVTPTVIPVVTPSQAASSATLALNPRVTTVFAPRFVSFASISNDLAINNAQQGQLAGAASSAMYNLNSALGGSTNFLVSVPEPGTITMCLGLLALAGYGYSMRRGENKSASEKEAILQGENNESISV